MHLLELGAATFTAQSTFAFLSWPPLSSLQNGGQPSNISHSCQGDRIFPSRFVFHTINHPLSGLMDRRCAVTTGLHLLFPNRFLFCCLLYMSGLLFFWNAALFGQTSWYKHNHSLVVEIKDKMKTDLLHFCLENETSDFSCNPLLSVQCSMYMMPYLCCAAKRVSLEPWAQGLIPLDRRLSSVQNGRLSLCLRGNLKMVKYRKSTNELEFSLSVWTILMFFFPSLVVCGESSKIKEEYPTKEATAVELTASCIHSSLDGQVNWFLLPDFIQKWILMIQ